MGREIRHTLGKKNKLSLPSGGNPGTPQSMALISSMNRVIIHNVNNNNNTAVLRRYSMNAAYPKTDEKNWKTSEKCGHCNGATYCNKNGLIYVTGYKGNSRTKRIVAFDSNTLKFKFEFDLPVAISGVAYDRVTQQFYASKGKKLYVFPYSAFASKDAKRNKYITYETKFSGMYQDVGGYNGVIYKIVTIQKGGTNYVDLYNAKNGKYLGSWQVNNTEIESVAVDENGYLHWLAATNRGLYKTDFKPAISGSAASGLGAKTTGGLTAPQAFVSVAKAELGYKEGKNNDSKYGKWYGLNHQPWCAMFISWCCYQALGSNKAIPKNALAFDIAQGAVNAGGKWIKKASKGPTTHVGLIASVSGTSATTVEGNHGDAVGSRTITVPSGTKIGDLVVFYSNNVGGIARPKWPDGTFEGIGDADFGDEFAEAVFDVHPDQLYSSETYSYEEAKEKEETEDEKLFKRLSQTIKQYYENIKSMNFTSMSILDTSNIIHGSVGLSDYKKPKTKIDGVPSASHLSTAVSNVEAPYVKLTIGGVTIGTYKNKNYPNYITGLSVKKTNGSLNEYTINLIHQVSPGDNPNYIDNLISANGYNKIKIEYGDANSGVMYHDVNALLINVNSNFDFFNNSIRYTLTATSSAVVSATSRNTYPEVESKPSDIIRKMLYETKELSTFFPGMQNQSLVASNNLIPNNDKVVKIDKMENVTSFEYLKKLVSLMEPIDNESSSYYLSVNDDSISIPNTHFKIKEIKTNISSFPFMYEVNVGFPDEDSLVFNFSVDTNNSWPLAYNYAGNIYDYNYGINNAGDIFYDKVSTNLKSSGSTSMISTSDSNWWKNVSEFPVSATLEIKGLSTYTLLLNYLKVNVVYYGNKRHSSGVYIILGQEDTLSANGFRTKLQLLKVAGDGQYITVDGRVAT